MMFLSVEESGSECDDLYNPEQDSDSSFSNESEPDLSESSNSLTNFPIAFLSDLGYKMNLKHLKLLRK